MIPPQAVRRILVRMPNWLGDVVMSTPGFRALRRAYPDAFIVGQGPEPLLPLLEGSGFFDDVWPVSRGGSGFARARAMRRDARRIADADFDLGILTPESISSALLMRWGGVSHTVGFARDPVRRSLLHRALDAPKEWGRRRLVSRERFVLELIQQVGAPMRGTHLELAVTEAESARLGAVLTGLGHSLADLDARPPVILAPGASYGPSKCWPAQSYAELGDRLAARGENVVVVGSPQETQRVSEVAAALKQPALALAGELDLGAFKALISRARLLVANDAGARHVAVALGVPALIFFGPTSVAKTDEHRDAITILETDHACRPCYARNCPIDHRCLREISVERAEERAIESLTPHLPAASVNRPRTQGHET